MYEPEYMYTETDIKRNIHVHIYIYIYILYIMSMYRCCSCLYIDRPLDTAIDSIDIFIYLYIYHLSIYSYFLLIFIYLCTKLCLSNSIYFFYHAIVFLYACFYIHSVVMTPMPLSISICNRSIIQTHSYRWDSIRMDMEIDRDVHS